MAATLEILAILSGDASKQLSSLKGNVTGLGKEASTASKGFTALKSSGTAAIAGIGVAVVAATGAIVGLGAKSTEAFIGFEKQMNEVFTLLPGISQDAMSAMSDQALSLSADFGILPEEVVPALYSALSAGVPPDNVFEFMETAAQASIGGITDLETAVDGITSVVNAYGEETINAASASDIMFTAVRLGKTNFEQLSASLFNVIPTAASLGISFEDVAAQMAVMTAQGVPTSVATTQLRAALIEASKGGTKLDEAFKQLSGKSFADLIASGKTSTEAFNDLRASMSDQEFKDLFGSTEALNAVLATTGPNFAATQAAMDEMTNSGGATKGAFDTMAESAQFTIDQMKAFGQSLLIDIGGALAPVIETVLKFAQDAMPKVQAVLEQVMPIIGAVALAVGNFFTNISNGMSAGESLSEVLWQLLDAFGLNNDEISDIVTKIDDFISGAQEMVSSVTAIVSPMLEAVAGFVSWKDVLIAVGIAIAAAVLPVLASLIISFATLLAPILAIVAVVALLRNAWESNFLGIQEIVGSFVAFIQEAIGVITAGFSEGGIMGAIEAFVMFIQQKIGVDLMTPFTTFQAFLLTAFELIKGIIASAIAVIQPTITTMIQTLSSTFQSLQPVLENFKTFWAVLVPFIQGVAAIIGGVLLALVGVIVGIVNGIIQAFNPFLLTLGVIINAVITFVTGVVQLFTGMGQLIWALVTGNSELLLTAWTNLKEGAANIWQGLVDFVVGLVVGLGVTLAALIQGMIDGIIGFFQHLYQTLVGGSIFPDLVNGIINWTTTLVANVVAQISAFVDSFVAFFVNLSVSVISSILSFIAAAQSAYENFIQTIISKVTSFVSTIISKFTSLKSRVVSMISILASLAKSKITSMINSMVSKIRDGAAQIISKVVDMRSQIIANLQGMASQALAAGKNLIQSFINGMANLASGVINKAKSIAQSAVDAIMGALNMGSPSKVMIEIGEFATDSLGMGLEKRIPAIIKSAARVANAVKSDFDQAFNSGLLTGSASSGLVLNGGAAALSGGAGRQIGSQILGNGSGGSDKPAFVVQGDLILEGVESADDIIDSIEDARTKT